MGKLLIFIGGVVVGIAIADRRSRIKTKDDVILQSTVPAQVVNN